MSDEQKERIYFSSTNSIRSRDQVRSATARRLLHQLVAQATYPGLGTTGNLGYLIRLQGLESNETESYGSVIHPHCSE